MTQPALIGLTEHDMLALLRKRYGAVLGNGPRYVHAEHVRSHAGFDARRTADFVAIDTWPSKGFAIHGHEVKVSRHDWLREIKHPEKAAEFIPYMTYWWAVVADTSIVKGGELPDEWGLMAVQNGHLIKLRQAPKRDPLPMPPTRLVALLRAVSGAAARHAIIAQNGARHDPAS